MSIGTPRRYYLLKRIAAVAVEDTSLAGVWRAKQEAQSGTALPDDFPHRVALSAAGYTAVEDLTGADAAELQTNAGLTARDAAAVITALGSL